MWTHIEDKIVKANKEHRCLLCGEEIKKGETYVKRFGFSEDGPYSTCMHEECEKETRDWSTDDWECTSPFEMDRPIKNEQNSVK